MVKRLIVACDGTWVNSDNGFVRDSWLPWKTGGHLAVSSNVTRFCRAMKPVGDNGTPQIVYYQAGLGSQNNFTSWLIGGFLGDGIDENIREAYAFLCNNYEDGDEIFLLGFSRGAFTARSIGALLSSIGLLTRKGLSSFYTVYRDWQNQEDKNWKAQYGTSSWPVENRPDYRTDKEGYVKKLHAAVAVWDTVGTLGVPDLKVFGISLYKATRREYAFVNTEVAPNVEHAYQALALDEQRAPFGPTIWESPDPATPVLLKELKQCWFPGVHTSVGGGNEDSSISDMTLAWMITQLSPLLSFDKSYIPLQRAQNEAYYASKSIPDKKWAMGQIPRSDSGLAAKITGVQPRTPGNYHHVDPVKGKPLPTLLANTCEFMHPSVRYRINQHGPGLASSEKDLVGQGEYYPLAMLPAGSWEWCPPWQPWGREELGFGKEAKQWDGEGKWLIKRPDGSLIYVVEDPILEGTAQMDLLSGWGEEVRDKVLNQ